ncbi:MULTISPECIES: asparaginase [unclassified Streptomyces]|uniref:asparaginase n=1 Tax=unclassified Streptomyces TaxID=2593676 RepID=UPI00278BB587|nr:MULTISPECIES: asparaginase [unclassified Streptomyces]
MADGSRRPVVTWIATGGTIEARGHDRMDRTAYGESQRRVPPRDLVAELPELDDVAEVRVTSWSPTDDDARTGHDDAGDTYDAGDTDTARPPSHAWTVEDLAALARRVTREAADPEATGVVVSCGTNGLEEVTFLLSLTVGGRVPVVVTGAMRPASALGGDGPSNLLDAVRVAADPASAGRGVLVVFDGSILAARDAAKTATYRLDAFRSPEFGPLGVADADGQVVYSRRPEETPPDPPFDPTALPGALPRVDVVVSFLGADGALVDAAVAAGAAGIVSAGLGGGYPTPAEQAALERAAGEGVLVCQASRVGSGRVVPHAGTRAGGFVAAGDLSPWKARLLLTLALAEKLPAADVQRLFAHPSIDVRT